MHVIVRVNLYVHATRAYFVNSTILHEFYACVGDAIPAAGAVSRELAGRDLFKSRLKIFRKNSSNESQIKVIPRLQVYFLKAHTQIYTFKDSRLTEQ